MYRMRLSGSTCGYPRNSTASVTLNTAVLTPKPTARIEIATAANPGLLRRVRRPKRRSLSTQPSYDYQCCLTEPRPEGAALSKDLGQTSSRRSLQPRRSWFRRLFLNESERQ